MHLDLGQMIVSSVVHGLIYDVIFKFTRHLTAWQTLVVAVIGVGSARRLSKEGAADDTHLPRDVEHRIHRPVHREGSMNDKILVTAAESARLLSMGRSTFWNKVRLGLLPEPVRKDDLDWLQSVSDLQEWPHGIFMVLGNHDHYDLELQHAAAAWRQALCGTRIQVLNRDVATVKGVRMAC